MSWRSQPIIVALSIAVAIAAMTLWVHNFGVSSAEFSQLFTRLRWWPIVPLFALLAGQVALSSWRWSLIEIGLGGARPSFREAFIAGAFALGLGTFLPSAVVNVACRGFANRIRGTSGMRGALSGGIDQVSDLVMVSLVAVPAILAFLHHDLGIYLYGAAGMVLLGAALILVLPEIIRVPWLRQRFAVPTWLVSFAKRRLLLSIYGISLVRLTNLTVINLAILAAVGASTVPAVVISVPLVMLAMAASMLPGGFGISEWSFSAVFGALGVAASEIVLFVLANRILITVLSLLLMLLVVLAMLPTLLGRSMFLRARSTNGGHSGLVGFPREK